jgi:4-oxalomesaconate hydratase
MIGDGELVLAAMAAQQYLVQYYTERAEHCANHARRVSGQKHIAIVLSIA